MPIRSGLFVDRAQRGRTGGQLDTPHHSTPPPATLRKVITVAAPFYGYGGQLHRWFEGESLVNGVAALLDYTKGIIKALSSFPGMLFLALPP